MSKSGVVNMPTPPLVDNISSLDKNTLFLCLWSRTVSIDGHDGTK